MVTQKKIAEKLGISRTTVARAINNSGYVKKETKEKILKLVSEMSYEKNLVGSSLASKKKIIYSFLVNSKNIYYTNEMKNGIRKIKEEYKHHNFKIIEISTDINEPQEQIKILREVLISSTYIDGIIIIPLDRKEILKILNPYLEKIKIVSIGIELDKNIPHIGPNYYKDGEMAAALVSKILRGDERVLIIDNGDDRISSKLYLDGFVDKCKEKNTEILGIFRRNGIEDSIKFLNFMLDRNHFSAIYINRYSQDILKEISRKKLSNKLIVTNGIGNRIKKLIKQGVIFATVADDVFQTGYMAGQIMFDILYKDPKNEVKNIISESRIILLENLI